VATTTAACTTSRVASVASTTVSTAAASATSASLSAESTLAASTSTTTTTAAASSVLAGSLSQTLTVKLNDVLLLALALALSLSSGSSEEDSLLLGALDLGSFRELLLAALVGLADVLGGEAQFLLGLLSKIGGVGDGLVLGFRLSSGLSGSGSLRNGILLFVFGDSLTSHLVCEFGVAVLTSPALCGLLGVLSASC
jgi:hypothetical protein